MLHCISLYLYVVTRASCMVCIVVRPYMCVKLWVASVLPMGALVWSTASKPSVLCLRFQGFVLVPRACTTRRAACVCKCQAW